MAHKVGSVRLGTGVSSFEPTAPADFGAGQPRPEAPVYSGVGDRALMARSAAYLWGSGATLAMATLTLPRPAHFLLAGILGPAVTAYAMVGVLLTWGPRLPSWFYRVTPVLGTFLITLVAYSGHEAAPAYALLYLWTALYVFYFLPRADAVLQVLLIAASYWFVLVTAAPFAVAQIQWLMTLGTVVVAAMWVRSVVKRLLDHTTELAQTGDELRASDARLRATVSELESSNRDLEQFAWVSAHDLQEPLRMVASYVQLLQKRYRGSLDADADEYIGYAVEGATRIKMLITDLLDYSTVSRAPHQADDVDVNRCVDAARRRLQGEIRASHARIVCDDLPRVRADATQIVLLFQNLISNAIKFQADSPPRVEIGARQQGSDWVFSVADNGIGIEAHQRERIFAVFQRLHAREKFEGTGIGLAICRKIVEKHGGRIWIESELGAGSTARFTLPSPAAADASGGPAAGLEAIARPIPVRPGRLRGVA